MTHTQKFLKLLEKSPSWTILGYVFVRHRGETTLILEMSSMQTTDLAKFTRWCQSKLKSKKVQADWATQGQMFELVTHKVRAWKSKKQRRGARTPKSFSSMKRGGNKKRKSRSRIS